MMGIISSTATTEAESFRRVVREPDETNSAWVARQLAEGGLTEPVTDDDGGEGAPTLLLLLGGRTPIAFRLRVAQSHLRDDLTPSHWSHAALLGSPPDGGTGDTDLHEISLEPPTGFGFATLDNGLQQGQLSTYDDPERFPNIALLRLPIAVDAWQGPTDEGEMSVLERFTKQRSVLDATALIVEWLAFVWGVGDAGNPILAGQGIPSAAMVETVLSGTQYDVTPGLESRASCPEAIWQAARWWHPYYEEQGEEAIRGCWHVEHRIADYGASSTG